MGLADNAHLPSPTAVKVLHVIPSLASCRGGASKAAIDMVAALRKQGVDAEIACTNDNGDSELDISLNSLIQYQGVPVRFFARYSPSSQGKIGHIVREFQISRPFIAWLEANIEKYDILHVHALFSYTSSMAMRLARRRSIPYVAHPIGSLERWSLQQSRWRKKAFLSLIDRRNLEQANLVHFTSKSEQQQASLVSRSLTPLILPLGLDPASELPDAEADLRKSHGIEPHQKIVLFLGRLHPKKGLELVLDAVKQREQEDAVLLVAGNGDPEYQAKLVAKVQDQQLSECVRFLGHVAGGEKESLLQGSNLFVLTSYSENFGIAVAEALSAGTAVLVSNAVGAAEDLLDQEVGLICQPNAESVRLALNELLDDPESLARMGQNAQNYASNAYDWSSIAQRLAEAYAECVHRA